MPKILSCLDRAKNQVPLYGPVVLIFFYFLVSKFTIFLPLGRPHEKRTCLVVSTEQLFNQFNFNLFSRGSVCRVCVSAGRAVHSLLTEDWANNTREHLSSFPWHWGRWEGIPSEVDALSIAWAQCHRREEQSLWMPLFKADVIHSPRFPLICTTGTAQLTE